MDRLIQEVRLGVRALLKRPGFAVIAILTLAIGIGANTTLFSVVNAVLLRPLPFRQPDRLMIVGRSRVTQTNSLDELSFPDFEDYRQRNRSFEGMAAYHLRGAIVSHAGGVMRIQAATVSSGLFTLLGVAPVEGRDFLVEEEKSGRGRVVILSHAFRRRQFGEGTEVLGKTLNIGGTPFEIVGVMPEGFTFPYDSQSVEMWTSVGAEAEPLPDGSAPTVQRGNNFFSVVGRLKPGVTQPRGQADLAAIAADLARQFPESNRDTTVRTRALNDLLTVNSRPALLVMFGAVGFVLLIACANIAGLQLARGTARRKELAVQAALGAGRAALIRKLLTENLLLALAGGIAGTCLSVLGLRLMTSGAPGYVPRLADARLDATSLAFSTGLTLLTGIAFGLAPAFLGSRFDLNSSLRESGSGLAGRQRLRKAMVIGQVAVAVVLLIGATLMFRGFTKMMAVNTGFKTDHLLTMRVSLPDNYYSSPPLVAAFHDRLIEAVRTTPGVKNLTTVTPLPFGGEDFRIGFSVEGRPVTPEAQFPFNAVLRLVGPNYFSTMSTTVVKGRDFNERDRSQSRETVVINETAAKRYFPNEDPIGKRINPSISTDTAPPNMREIIGVVADSRRNALTDTNRPELFIPISQLPAVGSMTIVARTEGEPMLAAGAIRERIAGLDPTVPISSIQTFGELVNRSAARPRFITWLLVFFGTVALILTAIGLYGVVATSVAQRTREFGIRLAIGAPVGAIGRQIVRHGIALTCLGLAIGIPAALFLNRLLTSLLYEISPTDPVTYAVVAITLALVTIAACWIPARKAARTDPMIALRHE